MPTQRSDIFISYSHRDREWLEKLQIHLKPLFREGEISVWDDTHLEPGSRWSDEIDQALEHAAAAVLLLSPDFFASDFIMRVEWPRLLHASKERGLKILPIAVRPSAVFDTDLGGYQGLMDLSQPLDQASIPEQGRKLVGIARRIRDAARRLPQAPAAGAQNVLTPLRALDTGMEGIEAYLFDELGQLWVSNGRQAKVFRIAREQAHQRWLLPPRTWKGYAPQVFNGKLVLADWDGALFAVNGNDWEEPFCRPGHDAVPFHILEACPGGELLGAAWDGTVRRWKPDGTPTGPTISLETLPTALIPLPDDAIAVADQSDHLRVLDCDGKETWSWHAGDRVRSVWLSGSDRQRALAAIVGNRRIVRIEIADRQIREQVIGADIVNVSRRRSAGVEWVVVASAGGRIDWASMSPFSIVRDNAVKAEFPIREIMAVPPQDASDHTLCAVGLTERGQVFDVRERRVRLYDAPAEVERLLMHPSGRFLFALSGDRIDVYRNPAIAPVPCRLEVAEVTGTLAVKGYTRLRITVRNSGTVPIFELRAELQAPGIIDPSVNARELALPVEPQGCVELEFAVLAHAAGDAVPLTLHLEVADEGGPPLSVEELRLTVQSR